MKKTFFLIAITFFVFAFFSVVSAEKDLSDKLRGRILLQVESHGEAWYVNPADNERYYLRDGDAAFNVMRQMGAGITNSNLSKISIEEYNFNGEDSDNDGVPDAVEDALGTNKYKVDSDNDGYSDRTEVVHGYNPLGPGTIITDNDLSSSQSGKILLQVESNGEAWYVNPNNHKRYFLGRPNDAYNLMRNLGLGITNNDLNNIAISRRSAVAGENVGSSHNTNGNNNINTGTDSNENNNDDDDVVDNVPATLCLANPVGNACHDYSKASNDFPDSVLKSQFFKNNSTANSIVDGAPYDMREHDYLSVLKDIYSIDNFAYKILSALRMLGYNTRVMDTGIYPGNHYSVQQLNKFQANNGFPVSEYLTSDVLKKLDAEIVQKEANYSLGRSFPLYENFVYVPETEVPKEHYFSIVAAAYKALPSDLIIWSRDNFIDTQIVIDYDYIKKIHCQSDYYKTFNHQRDLVSGDRCDLISSNGLEVISSHHTSDFITIKTQMHEYAHFLDGEIRNNFPGTKRGSIVNAVNFKNISWKEHSVKKRDINKEDVYSTYEFISQYSTNNWTEDFAEHFAHYVVNGKLFREASKYNIYLSQKYNWLKENVFEEMEYDTGGYEIGLSAGSSNHPVGLTITSDPEYIWDGKFLKLN